MLVAGVMLLPVAYLLLRALGAGGEAVSIVLSAQTAQLLWQTAGLAAAVTTAAAALGVPLAWLTTRTDLPFRRAWTILLVLPLVIPTYVGAFAFVAALGPRGLLQQALGAMLGIERLPEIYGFWGTALVLTLFTYPYVVLSVRGAMLRLDPAFEQASRSLGVGPLTTFVQITLPLLRPAITAGCLLVALYTLSDFGAVSLLQYDSFTRAIYVQYQGSLDRSAAAVLALVLVAFTAVILVLEASTRGRARYYRSARGAADELPPYRLGRWRWPATAFCAVVVDLAVVLPVGVLVYWLVRGVIAGSSFGPVGMSAFNSLLASGFAAGLALLAAVPVAILAVRFPSRLSMLLERVTYSAFALPGIVVALSLVFFAANYLNWLYQTLALLVCAYMIRFLPEAVGSLRSALLQVSPRLEEAASSLGRRRYQVLLTVTAPLVWPGAMAAIALVFMSAMKELPVTLLLSPIGFRTLATSTWNAAAGGLYAQAAVPSLLLVLVSAVFLPLVLRGEQQEDESDQLPE
jgi:iron(III) transport system permease protein